MGRVSHLCTGMIVGQRFRLDEPIGRGGMGVVWRAEQLGSGRAVAMKFLTGARDERDRQRLFREARTAGQVRHPHVVEVLDAFVDDEGRPVVVMELLEGESLAARMGREGRFPLAAGARLLIEVIEAVAAAHRVGVVHRDLKPGNIFLPDERSAHGTKVVDFGLAKVPGQSDGNLTTTGRVAGTPAYMAPEQCYGLPDVDHRADIWALGVLVHEVLSGTRPIAGHSVGRVLESLLTYGIPSLRMSLPDAPLPLVVAVRRMLEPNREQRVTDLAQIAEVLRSIAI
jgi:eukaryotic-like serine/threonine-protein kinase